MGKRNDFVMASQEGTSETELGLMMQKTNQSFPRKKMMMVMPPHLHHHHHTDQSHHISGVGGGGSFGGEAFVGWDNNNSAGGAAAAAASASGPLFCNTSNSVAVTTTTTTTCMTDYIYKSLQQQQQQPSSDNSLSFSSSGGMVNVNVKIPFTPAQREELERQTMIYKYMMSSAPVPPQLLVPVTRTPPNVAHLYQNLVKGSLELGISSNSDPEPWRCKRTDGKKWRCSRDVAPDQKYCERHAHKTRTRSRKPVESHTNVFINNNNTITMRSPRSQSFKHNNINQPTPYSNNMVPTASATSHVQPRALAWLMNGEAPAVGGSNQEWEQMMQFKLGLKSCSSYTNRCDTNVNVSKQQSENSFNMYREYTSECQGLQTQRFSHDQHDLEGALNSNESQQTRHFIDAWSTTSERDNSNTTSSGSRIGEIGHRVFVSSHQKLPFSSLTLSMSRGNEINEESENTQMGLGILGAERENAGDLKSQWMNPLSWMSSPPGGPLAEALCLGIASSTRAASSNGCNSGSTSCRSSSGDAR